MFVTQVFTRVPPKIDRAKAVALVRQKIVAVRSTLLHTPMLAQLAQQIADGLAVGESLDHATPTRKLSSDSPARSYQHIGSVSTATANLDALDGADLLGDLAAEDFGVGIAQGAHPEIGENAIWVVLVLATQHIP